MCFLETPVIQNLIVGLLKNDEQDDYCMKLGLKLWLLSCTFTFILLFQFHSWEFSPQEQAKSVMKPTLIVWGQGQSVTSSGGKKQQFSVRAIGEGAMGQIKVNCNLLITFLGSTWHWNIYCRQGLENFYLECLGIEWRGICKSCSLLTQHPQLCKIWDI